MTRSSARGIVEPGAQSLSIEELSLWAPRLRDVLKQMDLDANLSPTRRNGLFSMVQHIQNQARRAMGES